MSSSEREPSQGRGTEKRTFLYCSQDYIGEEGFNRRGIGKQAPVPSPVPAQGARLSRAGLPSSFGRDRKGKDTALFDRSHVGPDEQPWHTLDKSVVRHHATTTPAVLLPKNIRQAAGRDAGLEWDDQQRTYRLRRKATPAPRAATGERVEGAGGSESLAPPSLTTGAGSRRHKSCSFTQGVDHHGK